MNYIIKHKVEGYTGKSACVFFNKGKAETDDSWIASWFERKGHTVEKIEENISEEENIDYSKLKVDELKELAKEKGIEGYENMKKPELIEVLG